MGFPLNWRSPTGLFFIGVVVTIVLAAVVISALSLPGNPRTALSNNAPLIAAVVALGGVGTAQMVSIGLDRSRTQHEALQTYLAKMSELLLDKCLYEKEAEFDPVRVTARLQTLAVLERLDAEGKRTVVRFLREAQLINRDNRHETTNGREFHFYVHYVGLQDADLSRVNLSDLRLTSASKNYSVSLRGANLKDAKLSRATLSGADLGEADLSGTDLSGTNLRGGHGGYRPGVRAASPLPRRRHHAQRPEVRGLAQG
jgi:hypothetical protein